MREDVRDAGRIEHILQAIAKIEDYSNGVSFEKFVADSVRLHATTYNIQIIGEAT